MFSLPQANAIVLNALTITLYEKYTHAIDTPHATDSVHVSPARFVILHEKLYSEVCLAFLDLGNVKSDHQRLEYEVSNFDLLPR